MVQYIVKESIEYGCTVYNVINTKSGNRVNYFPDEKSAISFAERMNFFKNKKWYSPLDSLFFLWKLRNIVSLK